MLDRAVVRNAIVKIERMPIFFATKVPNSPVGYHKAGQNENNGKDAQEDKTNWDQKHGKVHTHNIKIQNLTKVKAPRKDQFMYF